MEEKENEWGVLKYIVRTATSVNDYPEWAADTTHPAIRMCAKTLRPYRLLEGV